MIVDGFCTPELKDFLGRVDFEDNSDMDIYRDAFDVLFVKPKLELIEDRIKSLDSMSNDVAIQVVAPLMGTIDDRVLRKAFTHEQLTEGVDYTYYQSTYPTAVHVAYSGCWMRVCTNTAYSAKFFGDGKQPGCIEKEPEPGSFDEVMNELVESLTPVSHLKELLSGVYSRSGDQKPSINAINMCYDTPAMTRFLADPYCLTCDDPLCFIIRLKVDQYNNTRVIGAGAESLGRILAPERMHAVEGSPFYMVFVNAKHPDYSKVDFPPERAMIPLENLKHHFVD
jgi:hypothetical protein